MPFHKISVFHRIKFVTNNPYSLTPDADIVVDSIHCEPPCKDKYSNLVPGRFDTAVINYQNGGRAGLKGKHDIHISRACTLTGCLVGYCIAQVRCIFTIPEKALQSWFGSEKTQIPAHLAYVEWFTPFSGLRPGHDHRMYKIKRHKLNGQQRATIIPVSLLRQSVHLVPVFGPVAPPEWKSSNVLELCPEFLVNSFSDRFQYCTLL